MNKFLNVCFQFGKWFVSIVLVLLICVGLYLTYSIASSSAKMNSYKMDYKYGGFVAEQEEIQQQETNKNYKEQIVKVFGDNKPTDRFVNKVVKSIEDKVEDRDVNDFINNLPVYYTDVKTFISGSLKKENKMSDQQIQQDYKNFRNDWDDIILEKYMDRYAEQTKEREDLKTASQTKLNTSLIALLICLCMFTTFLIVPILIKIEENTRK